MKINITARHFELTDAITNFIKEKLSKVEPLCKDEPKAHVILSIEKYMNKAEITLTGKNVKNNATAINKNMYNAIDKASRIIKQQISKHNKKLFDKRLRKGEKVNESIRFLG